MQRPTFFYFAAYRCVATRQTVVLSPAVADRQAIESAYDSWIANGQDPRVKLRFEGDRALLEFDEEAA